MNIVETERLSIREITKEDAQALASVLADPIVMKYSTVGVHSKAQIMNYIGNCQQQYELHGYGHWAIYNSLSGEFVGVCGLNKHDLDAIDVIHINYRLAANQQGKGYAVESTLGLLGFAKNSLKIDVVYALIEPENTSSVNVVNRTGFEFVKSSLFRGFKIDVYHVVL
ncbi:GNAT family N-acetyltransferase [Colwellia psychrerythraea]|uniref:GCN5-related N-acetyltransferase n=1 Tax=Colwellia psychrerythraea TaxID=28229 RepID=A0A099KT14_COLPS|nr:GNAT family N-acetyltransferase [Colwellia psychrerythraea]KGJ93641.1 GCN5-related N-acetyltransferase [Colwellia psychrerythraea]